jgi:hypothetical protein
MSDKKFFGKYRGTVLNNIDPMMMAGSRPSCRMSPD